MPATVARMAASHNPLPNPPPTVASHSDLFLRPSCLNRVVRRAGARTERDDSAHHR